MAWRWLRPTNGPSGTPHTSVPSATGADLLAILEVCVAVLCEVRVVGVHGEPERRNVLADGEEAAPDVGNAEAGLVSRPCVEGSVHTGGLGGPLQGHDCLRHG